MSKNKIDLDKNSQKRLKDLTESWHEPISSWSFDKNLKAADLRLLLENFAPLQNLIRALVAETVGGHAPITTAPRLAETQAHHDDNGDLAEQRDAALLAQEKAENEIRDLKKDLNDCNKAVESLIKARDEQKALAESLRREHEQAKQQWAQDRQKLERELWQCKDELNECQEQLQRNGRAPFELEFLRKDSALADVLGLAHLPADNIAALTRVVAVLSSEDGVKSVLSALKDRCEAENRAINANERALLVASVAWLNHNWPSHPYQLVDVPAHSDYKFETQQRFKHSATGDTVTETILLGFADSAGKVICKPLVRTV